jgi:putative aldouronate transport system substrate-binding protein
MVSILKKILALLLALCLTLGLMAGCGGSTTSNETAASGTDETVAAAENDAEAAADEDEDAAAPDQDEAEEEDSAEEAAPLGTGEVTELAKEIFGEDADPAPVTYPVDSDESLTLMATFPDALFASYPNGMADCQIYQAAEEATGIKIEYQPLSTSASSEQFNVIMASGSYPDLIGWGLNYATGDDAAVEEDIYLDLTEYIAQYAPNYYNLLSTDDELLETAVTDGGYIVGFHAVRTEESLGKAGLVIRTDLLSKLGLDKPYTIDDFENVLAAFKSEGLEQPLMMLAPGAIQDNWLAAAFDVAAFCNSFPQSVAPTYVEDGVIKFGPLEEGFKEYIELVHDWYEKGYIYSDFITANSNWNGPDYSNAITNGEAGIFYADWGNIGGYIDGSEVEGFDLEATYDMHATEDSVNHFAQFTKKSVGNGFHITSDCADIELACQWGDWWYSEEGSLLANYGVEGVSYEYVDGVPQFTETVTEAPEGMRDALLIYASNDTICCVIDDNAVASGYSEVDKAAPEIWATGMDDAYVIPSTVTLSADENTDANAIYTDIQTLCLESIAKFINGDKSLDEYDAFVENIKSMNIQGYLDIYQAAYDRAMGN